MPNDWRRYAIIVLLVALLGIMLWRKSDQPRDGTADPSAGRPAAPSPAQHSAQAARVSSASLQSTVIAPTLDTPVPAGKNVIWCSSFQLAWNKLKDDIVKAPVEIKGAEEIAKRPIVFMRKRGAVQPFFVMWVDNAELLTKR